MASDYGYNMAQDQAPAGWYQESDGGWRYWNGAAWTNVSPATSNAWPAPVNYVERASGRASPTISRGKAALATVCILLAFAFLGAMVQQPKGRAVVVGTTLASRADSSTTVGTSAPATTSTVTSPSKPTPATTAAVVENTVLAANARPVATTPLLQTSTNPTTAVATVASTAVATTVAATTSPTYSQEQIAYFQAVERAAQSATTTTQSEVVTPPSPSPSPSARCGASAYTNSNGDCVPRPIAVPTAPAGATAKCKDGTFSFSKTRSGTCSGHKGVAEWLP
jgi:Protein of unknown function (DUF3761)